MMLCCFFTFLADHEWCERELNRERSKRGKAEQALSMETLGWILSCTMVLCLAATTMIHQKNGINLTTKPPHNLNKCRGEAAMVMALNKGIHC